MPECRKGRNENSRTGLAVMTTAQGGKQEQESKEDEDFSAIL